VPWLIRQVEKAANRWSKAFDINSKEGGVLPPEERILYPDMLLDFLSADKKISVWNVENLDDEFERIALACSLTKNAIDNYSALTLDAGLLTGFKTESNDGVTADTEINKKHMDICIPTADAAIRLAELFLQNAKPKMCLKSVLERILVQEIIHGSISPDNPHFKLNKSETWQLIVKELSKELRKHV
jgi:hypothetical protein